MIRTELIAPVPVLLGRHAAAKGEQVAFEDAERSVTYAELDAGTASLAGHLADLAIGPGDTVAILLPNSVRWVECCLAIERAGGIGVPVSYDSSEAELEYRLHDARCKAIFTTGEKAAAHAAMFKGASALETMIVIGPGGDDARIVDYETLVADKPASEPLDGDDIDRVSYIVYTSGTTGKAKGVLLTTRGMLWVTAACWAPIAGLRGDDVVLSPLPLFHSYALNLSVLSIVALGAREYILPRYSTETVLGLLGQGRFTVLPGVPTMFHYLLEAAGREPEAACPGLRLCISAGAIMPATLNQEFEKRFGVPLLDGYGITETSTMVTMNWLTGGRVMGSCGLPLPGLTVRIVDPASGLDVDAGGEGELIVRGPNLMLGYHEKPAETASAIRDGWYHTGDLAKADRDGFITITGRLKELIIRGGQNIAPSEIEETVSTCACVLDCAVVGREHEHLGEVPVIFVVARTQAGIDHEEILGVCRARLSSYKVPVEIHPIDQIPRTGSGKIIRFRLKELLG